MSGLLVFFAALALLVCAIVKVAAYGRRLHLRATVEAAENALERLDAIGEGLTLAMPASIDEDRAVQAARRELAAMRGDALATANSARQELLRKGWRA